MEYRPCSLVAVWDNDALIMCACEACPSQEDCAHASEGQCVFHSAEATLMQPRSDQRFVSPLCSSNYMMKRQLDSTRNEVRIKVARSAEAQPEETDPAKAASVNLKLLGQNDPPSRRLTSPHSVCSCRCELCHPGGHLDVLRGSHTDTECKDEADIEDSWTNAGTKAQSW